MPTMVRNVARAFCGVANARMLTVRNMAGVLRTARHAAKSSRVRPAVLMHRYFIPYQPYLHNIDHIPL
jgi:hypothetical protein